MTVLVYTRHAITCPKQDDRYSRRCDCPKWFQYQLNGRQVRVTAKTRSWETASKKARELEARLEAGESPQKPSPITVADAIVKYLAVKESEGLQNITLVKIKGMMARLTEFCTSRGLVYLKDVSADHLQDWRLSWKFKKYEDGSLSASWKVHWAIIAAFFKHGHTFNWTPTNEAAKLKGFKTTGLQVQPFSKDEMTVILNAVPKCGWDAGKSRRVTALILLMRWSGLAIRDSVTLRRASLDNQGRIGINRTKTKTHTLVLLPPAVVKALQTLPEDNPGYFFSWNTTRKNLIAHEYAKSLVKVFETAGIKGGHSHRFRHTFACEMLIAGTPLETVSRLLGHKSIAVTERHYAAWVPERQTKLEAAVKTAWGNMELPG